MTDIKEILENLDNILTSSEFKDSMTYNSLLKYLVNSSLKKSIPKEITIAIEVFEKGPDFNTNKDSTVRHHIHTLRKKLDKYYRTEGIHSKIKFVIPKGHYEVKFFKNRSLAGFSINLFKIPRSIWFFTTLLFFLTSFFLLWLIQKTDTNYSFDYSEKQFPYWSSFFKNQYHTTIVIGDDFWLDEYRSEFQRYRQVRDWEINSEVDLNNFLRQFPNEKTWQSEIRGIPFGMLNNIFDLFEIIKIFNSPLSFRMSSDTNLDELKSHNLIYVGEFRNLRKLNKVLFNLPVRFQYQPKEKLFILSGQDTIETFNRIEAPYQQENKFNIDYSLIASMPGPSDENFLFIAGFGYSGRLERTKMLKDPQKLRAVFKELNYNDGNFPLYFIIVFEVESIERTGFKNSIKYFKAYEKDFFK
jgi:hypothetical protein